MGRLDWDYEEDSEFIVIAESEEEARQIVYKSEFQTEGKYYWHEWLDSKRSTCKEVPFKKGIVVRHWERG